MAKPLVRRKAKDIDEYPETVQIDVQDPIKERRTASGDRRLALNDRERQLIKERKLVGKALTMFIEKGMTIPKIAEELGIPVGVLAKAITEKEYPEFREAAIQRAISMFLDLESSHTRREIQEALGITHIQLRYLTQSEEFERMYSEHFLSLTTDPTLRAVQDKLVTDLLPKAYRQLDTILNDTSSPASVRLKAALEVLNKAGVQNISPRQSDRHELAEFLTKHNVTINIENMNVGSVPIPEEFKEAEKKTLPVVEGSFKDVTPDQ